MAPSPRLRDRSYGWFGVILCFAALELLTRTELVPSRHLPPPTATFRTLTGQLDQASLWRDLASTLAGWAIGLTMAAAIAVPLGVAAGSSALLYRLLRFPIEFVRPIPAVALVPLVVLVLGTGFESKVFLVALAAVWPLLIQTIYGIQAADPVATDTARAFGVRWPDRVLRVILPGALPYVATGVRLSSSVALTLAVTAELVVGSDGLGRSISLASEGGNIEALYSLIVVAGMVGWALNAGLACAERRVLHWHASVRRAEVPT